jgi:hypothetical protein
MTLVVLKALLSGRRQPWEVLGGLSPIRQQPRVPAAPWTATRGIETGYDPLCPSVLEAEMNARRTLNWAVVLLCVAVVGTGGALIWRLQTRPEQQVPTGKQQAVVDEQTQRLANWARQKRIPVTNASEWLATIGDGPADGCIDLPQHVTPVDSDGVSESQRQMLNETIDSLLQVYAENSPQLMVEHLAQHRMRLNRVRVEVMRETVARLRNVPIDELESLTPEQVYVALWEDSGANGHMSAIVADSGCIRFWQYAGSPKESQLQGSLGRSESRVFQNISQLRRNFEPIQPMHAVLESQGSVLFADVKVVIEQDAEMHNSLSPYFFRFWYNPADGGVWHAYQMGRVMTGSGGEAPLLF